MGPRLELARRVCDKPVTARRTKSKRARGTEFPRKMAKTAQVLSNLYENFFDFFDFAVFIAMKLPCAKKLVVGCAGRFWTAGRTCGEHARLGQYWSADYADFRARVLRVARGQPPHRGDSHRIGTATAQGQPRHGGQPRRRDRATAWGQPPRRDSHRAGTASAQRGQPRRRDSHRTEGTAATARGQPPHGDSHRTGTATAQGQPPCGDSPGMGTATARGTESRHRDGLRAGTAPA
jgi:hypothetical protein